MPPVDNILQDEYIINKQCFEYTERREAQFGLSALQNFQKD